MGIMALWRDWGLGQWESWAVHGSVHGSVYGCMGWCMDAWVGGVVWSWGGIGDLGPGHWGSPGVVVVVVR